MPKLRNSLAAACFLLFLCQSCSHIDKARGLEQPKRPTVFFKAASVTLQNVEFELTLPDKPDTGLYDLMKILIGADFLRSIIPGSTESQIDKVNPFD